MRKTLVIVGCVLAVAALGVAILEATDSTWRMRVRSGLTTGALIYASSNSSLSNIDAVAAGQVLTSAGTSTIPAWSAQPTFRAPTTVGTTSTYSVATTDSNRTYVSTAGSSTQTYTLPAASTAGLRYCFVAGNASTEILVNVQSGDSIVGKTHGAENSSGIATAAGTGIKNTAATNVRGDFTCLVSNGSTEYYMTSVAGLWATQ